MSEKTEGLFSVNPTNLFSICILLFRRDIFIVFLLYHNYPFLAIEMQLYGLFV